MQKFEGCGQPSMFQVGVRTVSLYLTTVVRLLNPMTLNVMWNLTDLDGIGQTDLAGTFRLH